MRYLVQIKANDNLIPRDQLAQHIENQVFPSFQALEGLEKEGKAKGGVVAGAREVVFIVDSTDNAEIDRLTKLPWWGVVETTVTPLNSFSNRIKDDKALIAKMKA